MNELKYGKFSGKCIRVKCRCFRLTTFIFHLLFLRNTWTSALLIRSMILLHSYNFCFQWTFRNNNIKHTHRMCQGYPKSQITIKYRRKKQVRYKMNIIDLRSIRRTHTYIKSYSKRFIVIRYLCAFKCIKKKRRKDKKEKEYFYSTRWKNDIMFLFASVWIELRKRDIFMWVCSLFMNILWRGNIEFKWRFSWIGNSMK